jgi:hypothetical protein
MIDVSELFDLYYRLVIQWAEGITYGKYDIDVNKNSHKNLHFFIIIYKPNYIDSNQLHTLTNHRYTTALMIQYKKIKNIQKHLDEMTHACLF